MPDPDAPPPENRRTRPSVDVPPSVLSVLSEQIGEAPRVTLREEPSQAAGAPLIDPTSDERAALPEGRGSYQVLGEIARGGMGVVLRGHDTDLGRDVAMKVLSKDLADRPEVVQRFVEEAQIGGQLQHPGIVPVYELGLMADERPYFTMKLVKGRTLAKLLTERDRSAASRRQLIDVFESTCQTVAYAHSRGVIHRDLKPANVMVGAFGEVQVVDWGLAKVLARGGVEDERRAREARSEFTVLETVRSEGSSTGTDSMVGSVMGTPAYMPPEQASGLVDRLDERSDVFALGAILCEILTGAPPYAGEKEKTLARAARAELEDAFARLDACEADPELVRLAKDCLVAAPAVRPADAGVVAERVQDYLAFQEERAHAAQIEAAEARVRATQERKARRLTLALGGSILVTLVVGGGGWLLAEQARVEREAEAAGRARALEADVGAALGEAEVLAAREEWHLARSAAERALALAQGGDAGAALVERVEGVRAEVDAAAEASRLEAERARDTARFLDELHEVRESIEVDPSASGEEEAAEYARAYAAVFDAHGIDLDSSEMGAAALTSRGLGADVVTSLDIWAESRRRAGDEAGALHLLDVAHRVDPDPLRADLREAVSNGDLEMLRTLAAGEFAGQPPATLQLLAESLLKLGDRGGAFDVLRRAARVHPADARLHRRLAEELAPPEWDALGLQERRRYREALSHAWTAVALQPESSMNRILLGRILDGLGRSRSASEILQDAVDLRPESTFARLALGVALSRLEGEEERALRELRAARQGDVPAIREFWSNAFESRVLLQMGDAEGAIELIDRGLELNPTVAAIQIAWIQAMLAAGRLEDVERSFEEAPHNLTAYNNIAWALATVDPAAVGDAEYALRCAERGVFYAERAVQIAPEDSNAWNTLATAHLHALDFAGALEASQRSMELGGGVGFALDWFIIASCHVELGDPGLATQWYERGRIWLETSGHPRLDPELRQVIAETAERLGVPVPPLPR